MGLKAVKNMTIEEVEREIKQTNENPEHPYWIDHPKHQVAVERMTALFKRLYPPEKSKYSTAKRSSLRDLVDFLNIDFESPSAWERWKIYRPLSTEKIDQPDELRNARDLQSEIKNDLSPIADWRGIPKEHFAYDERWFDLCEKLNEMNFQRRWRVDIEALSKKKDFFIPKFDSWNLSNNDREKWYALVGYLLENGEIERLRKCSYCGDFFEARDGRQRFCKTKCKDEFFKPTAASRMKKSREKRKKEQERMARKEGKKFRMEKEKALEQNFRALINEMMQGKKGSLVKKLGREQYQAGWNNFVLPWNAQIKRGSSLREILKSLSNEDKEILEPYLIPPEERETVTIL